MDFKSGQQLIGLCETNECPISEIMLIREETFTERTRKDIINQMGKTWQIMKESAHSSVENPKHSIGGLIGGEAKLLSEHLSSGKSICKDPLSRAITYSMSILETSASMGLIVAAPTAGSAGIVPGLLLALQETYDFSDNDIIRVLFNAGAVGCLAMRNATVAGAVGGCQAEVGVASAMAASAAVELMQGTARQCLDAASTVLMNMLGLVCDPVGGLVECPCQMRNASGVANALTAAEIVLSGVPKEVFSQVDKMKGFGLDVYRRKETSCRIPRNRSRRLCSYFYGMFPLSVSRKYFAACRPVISPNDRS